MDSGEVVWHDQGEDAGETLLSYGKVVKVAGRHSYWPTEPGVGPVLASLSPSAAARVNAEFEAASNPLHASMDGFVPVFNDTDALVLRRVIADAKDLPSSSVP